jgi:hypothetical protein
MQVCGEPATRVCYLSLNMPLYFAMSRFWAIFNASCATAHASVAQEAWAVITDTPPSLQTFALYGQRFGGIEPHFKDYKSAAFKITRSKIRDAQA